MVFTAFLFLLKTKSSTQKNLSSEMRITTCIILFLQFLFVQAQNPLVIPPSLTGTNFNLTVQSGTQTFYGTTPTPTYGINGAVSFANNYCEQRRQYYLECDK